MARVARDTQNDAFHFDFKSAQSDVVSVGETCKWTLRVQADANGSFDLGIAVYSTEYTGGRHMKVKEQTWPAEAMADATEATFEVTLTPDEYKTSLQDHGGQLDLEVRAFALVKEASGSEYGYAHVHPALLALPVLQPELETTDIIAGGDANIIKVVFQNPCPFALGKANIGVHAQHHLHAEVSQGQGQEIDANATVSFEIQCKAESGARGPLQVAVELDTQVLHDILFENPLVLNAK